MTGDLRFAWLPSDGERSEQAIAVSRGWLTEPEQARAERFVRDRDRRLFLLARFLARALLAEATSTEPADWRFGIGPHDRPVPVHDGLAGAAIPDCNWSHTEGLACAVVGEGRVGVDTERLDRRTPDRNPGRFLTEAELEQCRDLSGSLVTERFWRIWTLKEAWLKCLGTGVAGGLRSVSLRLDQERPSFDHGGTKDAGLSEIRPIPSHTCAIASRPAAMRVLDCGPEHWSDLDRSS